MASRYKLIFDNREQDLIAAFQRTSQANALNWTVQALDVGDIVFQRDEQIVMIIERKTKADLAASIVDGRYHNQKRRILANYRDSARIMYLIEKFYGPAARLPDRSLQAALNAAILRDDIDVYHTPGIPQSATFIAEFIAKAIQLDSEDKLWLPRPGQDQTVPNASDEVPDVPEARPLIDKKKAYNTTPENALSFMLAQIPKVGPTFAVAIQKTYPTMGALLLAYENSDYPETMLMNLPVSDKRRVGEAVSRQIYTHLFGVSRGPSPQ